MRKNHALLALMRIYANFNISFFCWENSKKKIFPKYSGDPEAILM